MKTRRIAFLLALLLFAGMLLPAPAHAAETEKRVLHKFTNPGETITYYYNTDGSLSREESDTGIEKKYAYYSDGTAMSVMVYWGGKLVEGARYDSHGQLRLSFRSYPNEDSERLQCTNTYDEEDRLLKSKQYAYVNGTRTQVTVVDYFYEESGYCMVQTMCYEDIREECPVKTQFTYYDPDGNLTGEETYIHSYDSEGYATEESGDILTYIYDEQQNPLEYTHLEYQNGTAEQTWIQYSNSYDTADRLVKVEQTVTVSNPWDMDSEAEEYSIVTEYRYDSAGRMIREETALPTHTRVRTWEYDRYGDLVREASDETEFISAEFLFAYVPLSQALDKE